MKALCRICLKTINTDDNLNIKNNAYICKECIDEIVEGILYTKIRDEK